MLLKNRTAIVYGASGAVGAAVARAFGREGATVVLAARRPGPLHELQAELRGTGAVAESMTVDATDPADIQRHLQAAAQRCGPVNLMFNAIPWGDIQGAPLAQMAFADFFSPILGSMTTWFHTGTQVAQHMARHGGGTILGITANVGRAPAAQVGGFGVACAAVDHYLRQLAVENGPSRVRVCWVRSPGSPDAPGVRDVWQQYGQEKGMTVEEVHHEFAKDVPLRRITPLAEVANAAVLLASDLASAMTATLANATGGAQID